MSKKLKILGLIPARAGSKRVKNKNIRFLGGKPLVAYTIEAAKKSTLINRIILTTNSKTIAGIGRKYGAETPFLRPKEISQGTSTEFEFHFHAIEWLKKNEGYVPDLIVNLHPTTPFRKPKSIDLAIKKILAHPRADSLRSITKCSEHPYKMWLAKGDYLEPFVPKKDSGAHTLGYQQLPIVYIQNASIYITKPKTLYKYHSSVGEKVLSFIMDEMESVDINCELDFLTAESLLSQKL